MNNPAGGIGPRIVTLPNRTDGSRRQHGQFDDHETAGVVHWNADNGVADGDAARIVRLHELDDRLADVKPVGSAGACSTGPTP